MTLRSADSVSGGAGNDTMRGGNDNDLLLARDEWTLPALVAQRADQVPLLLRVRDDDAAFAGEDEQDAMRDLVAELREREQVACGGVASASD